MKHINYFSDIGLNINITPDGNLKIQGLSSLQSDLKNQVLQYAKKNKWRILFELQTQNNSLKEKIDILWHQADELAEWIDDSSSNVPWQERAARVSELQEMSLEIDRLKAKTRQVRKPVDSVVENPVFKSSATSRYYTYKNQNIGV